MSYYAVLEATNALVEQQQWALQRCRRRCDGPARYILIDQVGVEVSFDRPPKKRRLGFTLEELLQCLCQRPDTALANSAQKLLDNLNIPDYR